MHHYQTKGVCSRNIEFELRNDKVFNICFEGGCDGNLKAIAKIAEGMSIEEIAAVFEGLTCGSKKTSCVDQLVQGLRKAQNPLET